MCSVLQWGLEHFSNETCMYHSINHSIRNEFLGDEVEIHSAVIKAGEMKSEGEGLQIWDLPSHCQDLSWNIQVLAELWGLLGLLFCVMHWDVCLCKRCLVPLLLVDVVLWHSNNFIYVLVLWVLCQVLVMWCWTELNWTEGTGMRTHPKCSMLLKTSLNDSGDKLPYSLWLINIMSLWIFDWRAVSVKKKKKVFSVFLKMMCGHIWSFQWLMQDTQLLKHWIPVWTSGVSGVLSRLPPSPAQLCFSLLRVFLHRLRRDVAWFRRGK